MDNLDLAPEATTQHEDFRAPSTNVDDVQYEDLSPSLPDNEGAGGALGDVEDAQTSLISPPPSDRMRQASLLFGSDSSDHELTSLSQNDDVGISLPNVEEVKQDIPTQRRAQKYKLIGIASAILLVIIVGVSAGVGSKSGGDAKAAKREALLTTAMQFIETIQVSPMTHLTTPGTPQYQAVNWIVDDEIEVPPSMSTPGAHKFVQRYVLAVLFYALNGSSWKASADFLSENDECDWNQLLSKDDTRTYKFGASCGVKGTVTELFLPGNKLVGSIPVELGYLTDLSHISMFNNDLTGELPETLTYLSNLDFFAVDRNQISGSLPSWVGQWTNLETLGMSENSLGGNLPSSIAKMTSLKEVAFDSNKLSGGVDVFYDLPALEKLYLGHNLLEGTVDETFFANSNVRDLDIGSNFFDGGIPIHLFNDHKIHLLDIHDNELMGDIPAEITENTILTYFAAYDNELDFAIPTSISNLKNLKHLDLTTNKFTGTIPTTISEMTALEYLFLSYNNFTAGPIPDLQKLVELKDLSLKYNQLTGSIPTEIGLLTKLILLDMGNNQIEGHLPLAMQGLTSLRFLVMNDNILDGTITKGFRKLESIDMIILDNNNITGGAEHICDSEGPKPGPSIFSTDCCEGDNCSNGELECECCTLCCAGKGSSCYTRDTFLANHDLEWFATGTESDYSRTAYVFSEDIVFGTV